MEQNFQFLMKMNIAFFTICCLLIVVDNSQSRSKVLLKETQFRQQKPTQLKWTQKNTQTNQSLSRQIQSRKTQSTQTLSNQSQRKQISNKLQQKWPKNNRLPNGGIQTNQALSRFQLNQAPSIQQKKESLKQFQYGQSQSNRYRTSQSTVTKPNPNQPQMNFSQTYSSKMKISQRQQQNSQYQSNNIQSPKQTQSQIKFPFQQKINQSQIRQTLNQPQTIILPNSQSLSSNRYPKIQVSNNSQSIYPQTNRSQIRQTTISPSYLNSFDIQITTPLTNSDHQLRMTPILNTSFQQNRYLQFFSKVFEIGAAYFKKVITVSNLNPQQTVYRGTKCGNSFAAFLPEIYKTQGFNQNTTDMIVVVTDQLQITPPSTTPDPGTIAQASSCDFNRRVTYARITYRPVKQIQNSTSVFHQWVQITIHEMFHFLGFQQYLYPRFISVSTGYCENNSSNCYITTPKVKQYVQQYFNCSDNSIGAMLQNKTSDTGHWNLDVYRNEIMTPLSYQTPTGNIISKLSLLLLADTGFYSYVNTSYSQPASWGYKRGCDFAKGNIPEHLKDRCEIGCDFYSRYVKNCSDLRVLLECQNPGFQSTPDKPGYFGRHSRCFNGMRVSLPQPIFPSCLKAECDNQFNIRVSVNGTEGICDINTINRDINISNITIRCPFDYIAFCRSKSCENVCDKRGLCLNGECLYLKS